MTMPLWLLLAAAASATNLRASLPATRTVVPVVAALPALKVAPLTAASPLAPLAAPSVSVPLSAPLPVLSAPEAAFDAPQALAAPADAPGFVHRTLGALGKLIDPFGGKREPGDEPPVSEAVRLDREFMAKDLWGEVAPAAKAELAALRARKLSKAELKAHVAREAAAAFERVKAARGAANIGLHFNLHGGRREDYVGAGIRASKGDIALRYSMNADANDKVYFFQTSQHEPYTALDASNGEILFWPTRMGHVLNVFAVDAPALEAAKADGRIRNHGPISMDFHGLAGVPYSAYLAPPLPVFDGSAKKALGLGRLSRDEETLATVRYLEAALLAGGPYIPR